jgi:hypothetical protein
MRRGHYQLSGGPPGRLAIDVGNWVTYRLRRRSLARGFKGNAVLLRSCPRNCKR